MKSSDARKRVASPSNKQAAPGPVPSASGRDRGKEYEERMRAYLAREEAALQMPFRGVLNVTAIARGAEIPVQSIYKNPTIRALVGDEARRRGCSWTQGSHIASGGSGEAPLAGPVDGGEEQLIGPPSDITKRSVQALERRVHRLEQQNATLVAENAALRKEVGELRHRLGREDMMIETGRRIPAPDGNS